MSQGPTDHHCRGRGGTHQERGRPRLRRLPVLGPPAGPALPRRGRGRVRAPLQTPAHQPACRAGRRSRTRSSGSARSCPGRVWTPARTPSAPTWPAHPEAHDLVAEPATGGLDDLADPDPPRVRHRRNRSKRPRSSWRRFAAEQPNERWQADTTHWQLADGTGVEILNILDDHSRLALASVPRRTITGPDVAARLPRRLRALGNPRQRAHRQRRRLHRPTPPRRPGRPRDRARPPRRPVRPLPPQPPPDPAARSNGSSKPRRSGSPPNHPAKTIAGLQRQLDPVPHATTTTSDPTEPSTAAPPAGLHRPTQSHRHRPLHRPALPRPTRPHRPRAAPSPCATTPASTTSASADAAPAPPSPCSSTTSTSASSTATPANSSANSPSTPPATSNPADVPTRTTQEEPLKCNDVPRHLSTVSRDITLVEPRGLEPLTPCLQSPRTAQPQPIAPRPPAKPEETHTRVGGAKGTRTPNPLLAKQVRYQLRHGPQRAGATGPQV